MTEQPDKPQPSPPASFGLWGRVPPPPPTWDENLKKVAMNAGPAVLMVALACGACGAVGLSLIRLGKWALS